jgi:hypothetical protein
MAICLPSSPVKPSFYSNASGKRLVARGGSYNKTKTHLLQRSTPKQSSRILRPHHRRFSRYALFFVLCQPTLSTSHHLQTLSGPSKDNVQDPCVEFRYLSPSPLSLSPVRNLLHSLFTLCVMLNLYRYFRLSWKASESPRLFEACLCRSIPIGRLRYILLLMSSLTLFSHFCSQAQH